MVSILILNPLQRFFFYHSLRCKYFIFKHFEIHTFENYKITQCTDNVMCIYSLLQVFHQYYQYCLFTVICSSKHVIDRIEEI